ncbi:protein LURP-one-related 15 isoform X2 [Physcomitrium patens]|uniref:protein LURP-one-related 15 isoform X2 n=1 Tax=Physcomitrium patens TaxID=3218 RepID=UPI000D152618|nr:protein LURP-one-related 15-like isoform X2 [Physcomitrium patens]|eukprot:XP_024390269.1 protein LURP-one-related 15-like isoform X2 [Physcomitrella patens]
MDYHRSKWGSRVSCAGKKGGLVQVQAGAGGRKWKSCCVYGRKGSRTQSWNSIRVAARELAQKKPDYTIEGSFLAKKCLIYFGEELVTEVTREASLKNILITKSIFNVIIHPGVDVAFIFSIIIIMDKIYVHDD